MTFRNFDIKLIHFAKSNLELFARLSLFIIYFWFGILKVLGFSPATQLVTDLFNLTFWSALMPIDIFMILFGAFEMLIGVVFLVAPAKREIYTSETFLSRLTRGERTDAITIWDMATLLPKGEIILPGGKRQQSVTYTGTFQFTNADAWALVANFTPVQSITVVDLDGRKVLGEIDLPGCAHIYPTGTRGFSSLCTDGSMISITLDEKGAVASSKTFERVQDIDNQPLFGMPAMVGKTAWFVSYKGELRGFDLSGPYARALKTRASVGSADGGAPEWRPGGWQVIASDATGLLYVLMHAGGREGSHKDGGTEVWVVDPVANKRLRRIDLGGLAVSITVTREAVPHLVVARPDAQIDVFDAVTGKLAHTLGATVAANPLVMTPAR